MAGNIKMGYGSNIALTVTNLHSLASSQDGLAGWGSADIDNTSNLNLDHLPGFTFTTHASNRQAGFITVYVVPAINQSPTYPAVSSGTLGTEGAIAFVDTEERDSICEFLLQIPVDSTASAIKAKLGAAISSRFGGRLPSHYCLFITQNCTTTTTAGLAASGSAVHLTPTYHTYT